MDQQGNIDLSHSTLDKPVSKSKKRKIRRQKLLIRLGLVKQNNNTSNNDSTQIRRKTTNTNETNLKSINSKLTNLEEKKEMEPLRKDVLQEREAKKLAKQKAKAAKTSSDNAPKETVDRVNQKLTAILTENIKVQSSSKDEVDRAVTITLDNEKTREQIKAEREAKKLAKQSKKKLPSSVASVDVVRNSVVQTKPDKKEDTYNVKVTQEPLVESKTEKSKAELKAERRAKQEAQRAAKAASTAVLKQSVASKTINEKKPTEEKLVKVKITEKAKSKQSLVHKVKLFQHLYNDQIGCPIGKLPLNSKDLHPSVLRLGVKYQSRTIKGSNARCIALLDTLKQVIRDYALPAKTDFARGLETYLANCLNYLWSMRMPTASMTNAVKYLRCQLTQLPNNINEYDAKSILNESIDTYIFDQIEKAGEAISIAVCNKISNGDNILTYGCSSLIEKILKEAWGKGLQFRTIVVGSRCNGEGLEMLRRLNKYGLPCTYINISAISYLMRTVNKVLLGVSSLLGNGWVLGRAGTAQIALAANAFNVPVLVCCETHKFSERVQTDAFVYNEIGNPDALIGSNRSPLKDWRTYGSLTPLNLEYDVTSPSLVTAVVTELSILPCTSAPVVLRYKLSEYGM